ncbi:MAG: LD-carboxypeptidase [Terriglobales bacterium]|jgi:muramoyltetrapeptide carboxypeptidase
MPSVPRPARIKPPALQPGDTVGIVAPASEVKPELLEAGCETLRRLGYKPFYFDSIFDRDLYFAGTVERRARELEEMFVRDEVRAILCARGGYGSNYLLKELDLKKIKAHPKIFVGYSDLTTLLTYFADVAGFVTFQGPMVAKDFARPDGVDLFSWQSALQGLSKWDLEPDAAVKSLVEGSAEGILYGGCLSMLVASLGTPYEIRTAGTILFIEDVATKPYQIDRMLMQLKLAGKFADVQGIVFGEMLDCVQTQSKDQGFTLEEVVLRVVGDLGVPVAYGLRSGHVSRGNITLPLGVRAALNVSDTVELKIPEAATLTAVSSRSAGRE